MIPKDILPAPQKTKKKRSDELSKKNVKISSQVGDLTSNQLMKPYHGMLS